MRERAVLLAALLALGCKEGRSLVLVSVSLGEPGIKVPSVDITVTPTGGSDITRTFDWSQAHADVLSAGIFLPAGVEGLVAVRAAAMDPAGQVEALSTATVQKGKATEPVPLALRRAGGAPPPDGGPPAPDGSPAPDGGTSDSGPPADLSPPGDSAAPPADVAPAEPPSLTRCQVYEHAGPCTITPTTTGIGVWELKFSPDGKYLVTGGDDGRAKLWRVSADGLVDDNRALGGGARGSAPSIAFSGDGARMALGEGNGTVTIYEFPRGTVATQLIGHTSGIGDVFFSSDGSRVVSVDLRNNAKLWDATTGKELKNVLLPGEYRTVALSPAGHPGSLWLAVDFAVPGLTLLDLASDPVVTVKVDTPTSLYAIAFSRDGNRLAVSPEDGSMVLWDVSDKQKPTPGPTLWPAGAAVINAAYSPDGRFVVGGCSRGEFGAGDLKLGAAQPPGLRASNATPSSVMNVDFSPDGRAVAAGSWRCGKITYCKD